MKLVSLLLVPALLTSAVEAQATRLVHFTDDLTASGTDLLPNFRMNSCWSGLTVASDGRVHIAISNHLQPGGDCGFFRFDPDSDELVLLGTASGVSGAAGNWMGAESQYKVHTFQCEDPSGRIWFATMDHDPSPFLRGAHLYYTDVDTGVVTDHSATAPTLLREDLVEITNTQQAAVNSGVTVATYGIKGIGMNPRKPDIQYLMTFPDGHLIKHEISTGSLEAIGQSSVVSYVFHVDRDGDCHYAVPQGNGLRMLEYDLSSGQTTVTKDSFSGIELGAVCPHPCGEIVYVLVADTKEIWRLDTRDNSFVSWRNLCGTNFWRVYNLGLSPNGRSLYYVSNNNPSASVRKIDVASTNCTEFVDVESLTGTRNLCFGGVNSFDNEGRYFAPVWTFEGLMLDDEDVALLEVETGELPFTSDVGSISLGNGGTQTMELELGPDAAGKPYFIVGTSAGTSPGFAYQAWSIPLNNAPYLMQTIVAPNFPPLGDSFGLLDANGKATITFSLPPGSNPAFAGARLNHCPIVFREGSFEIQWVGPTNAVTLLP